MVGSSRIFFNDDVGIQAVQIANTHVISMLIGTGPGRSRDFGSGFSIEDSQFVAGIIDAIINSGNDFGSAVLVQVPRSQRPAARRIA